MHDALTIFIVLTLTIVLFIWGKWRYDTVALLSLMLLVFFNLVPASEAFIGFSNPAVITVAAVMVITKAINQSGLVEQVVSKIAPLTQNVILHIGVLTTITAILSAFMNNVGALALMMPIAISSAKSAKLSPSTVLMPLSFASVLGGLCTSIGTPPNLLISAYREEITGQAFSMFDFSPVGVIVSSIAIIFIAVIGFRLVPIRQEKSGDMEEKYPIQDYITEIRIPEDSPVVGINRYKLEHLTQGDFTLLGIIRGRKKRLAIPHDEQLQAKDILIIEASHDDLHNLLDAGKLELVGGEIISPERLTGDDITTIEAVVPPGSRIEGRSWQRMRIRSRLQVNLLAIARSGRAFRNRLNHVNLNAGDVVLLQGHAETIQENIVNLGLVPLAERQINVGFRRKMLIPIITFLSAILLAGFQFTSVAVAFTAAVLFLVIFNVMPMRQVYKNIDFSIIVLLAAMIPVGGALQSSGATELISQTVLAIAGKHSAMLIIGILLFVTMTLSDVMNNAATAVVMSPIAVSMAQSMHLNVDPFLMAVSVGASCSFLTPISHQNNTLVMGPGGYKFYDYLRLGIPVEIIVLILAIPAISWFWL
jgi:di/tricarboxylate transporter